MSGDSERRRGGMSRYLNGGTNALMRAPSTPGDELQGGWSREQLVQMDLAFCKRMERAFRLGREQRASASACERANAGDRDRVPLVG